MTKQSTIVRTDPLEQAIQTVVQDLRIPKDLRIALANSQRERTGPNNHGISVVPSKFAGSSTAFRLAESSQPNTSGSCVDSGILNGVRTDLAQRIDIQMWINVESLDWVVEINGHLHKNIPLDFVEALIECAVISAASSVMKTFSARPQ